MGIYLNSGNEAFRMDTNGLYIDKTMLIAQTNKAINTAHRFIAVSRPRRFGKTLAADMLVAYYCKNCDSSDIFDKYAIRETEGYRDNLNKYNVIKINMQNFLSVSTSIEDMLKKIDEEIVRELEKNYSIETSNINLAYALDNIYDTTKDKFIFVIDEWDCIMREKELDKDGIKKYLDYLRNLLKDKTYVALCYMTGILPIKKYGTHSAINMFDEYSMTNPNQYAEFVGITEEEAKILCDKYKVDFDSMKDWYNGYYFEYESLDKNFDIQTHIYHIYNPRAVVATIEKREFQSYWTRTETYEALKMYIQMNMDGLKEAILRMLSGEKQPINIEKFQNDMTTFADKDDVLTLLVHLGYLAYDKKNLSVYIPNKEIRAEFKNALEGMNWKEVINAIQQSETLLNATWKMDCQKVADIIENVHSEFTSILKYNDENSLTCVLSIAYYNAMNFYTKVYEMPSGNGYADIAFIPRNGVAKPALLIELKYDKNAETAIEQIKNNNYPQGLKEYKDNMLLVGINYDKDTKKHICKIEKWK